MDAVRRRDRGDHARRRVDLDALEELDVVIDDRFERGRALLLWEVRRRLADPVQARACRACSSRPAGGAADETGQQRAAGSELVRRIFAPFAMVIS
jgi:hypothetical protein